MGTKKKYISVDVPSMKAMSEKYGVTIQTVYNALKFYSNSEKAKSIREDAISIYKGKMCTKMMW